MRAISSLGPVLALFVLAVAACSDDRGAAPLAHSRLECVGEETSFNPPVEIDISGPGAASADSALRAEIERNIARLDRGEAVVLSDTEYGLAVDGRVVSVHRAATNDDGEWRVIDAFYCSADPTGEELRLAESE